MAGKVSEREREGGGGREREDDGEETDEMIQLVPYTIFVQSPRSAFLASAPFAK